MADPLSLPALNFRGQRADILVRSLLPRLWNIQTRQYTTRANFYLDHYKACLSIIDIAAVEPLSHHDVIEIVDHVKSGRKKTRLELAGHIISLVSQPQWLKARDITSAFKAIDLGYEIWLMLDPSIWTANERMDKHVRSLFAPPVSSIHTPSKDITYNARTLHRIGGLELAWTSQLNEHLRSYPGQIRIFRHASILTSGWANDTSDLFPPGLLIETAKTMSILFPSSETPEKRWDKRIRKKADVDVPSAIACKTPRYQDHYTHWQERLSAIQNTLDATKPKTVRQWIYDGRDGNMQATFWLTVIAIILALLFGLIQSVTGIMQVVIASRAS